VWLSIIFTAALISLFAYKRITAGLVERHRPSISQVLYTEDVDRGTRWEAVVEASGLTPLGFQWYRGLTGDTDQPVKDADTKKLVIEAAEFDETYWVRVTNEYGEADSQPVRARPRYVVETIDYKRELNEALALSREILDKAKAANVSREQLHDAFVEIPDDERSRWTNLLDRAEDRQRAASLSLAEKLEYLATLDRDLVSESLVGWTISIGGTEGARQTKAIGLLNEHWLKTIGGDDQIAASLVDKSDEAAVNY